MRHTPVLDRCRVSFREPVSDHLANVLDACLSEIERMVDWGVHPRDGRRRRPCDGQPILLAGMPLGQHHCPCCGEMQLAGWAHLPPDEDYELAMGRDWPAGYEEAE